LIALSPVMAAVFVFVMLFMWTFAIPFAAIGAVYVFTAGRSRRGSPARP
jgi:hypothetical protein